MSVFEDALDSLPTVKELIHKGVEINNPGKSQRELAIEMGLAADGVSMLSMVKSGKAKLKLGRVGKTARVLKLDPTVLLMAALKERVGDDDEAWSAVREVFNSIHSEHEAPIVQALREVEKQTGQKAIVTDDTINRLKDFIKNEMMI